jgi:hypothetical protein
MRHQPLLMLVIACTVAAAGCQMKSAPVPPNFISVDPNAFVLRSVERYADPQGDTDWSIVVVKATYTNVDQLTEPIDPSRFTLIDPNLQTNYLALSGGNLYVPEMANSELAPGKSTVVDLAFRVPSLMTTARLAYKQD